MILSCCLRSRAKKEGFVRFEHEGKEFYQISREKPEPASTPIVGKLDRLVWNLGRRAIKPLAFLGSVAIAAAESETIRNAVSQAAETVKTFGAEIYPHAAPYLAAGLSAIWALPAAGKAIANRQWKKAVFYTTIGTLAALAPQFRGQPE